MKLVVDGRLRDILAYFENLARFLNREMHSTEHSYYLTTQPIP